MKPRRWRPPEPRRRVISGHAVDGLDTGVDQSVDRFRTLLSCAVAGGHGCHHPGATGDEPGRNPGSPQFRWIIDVITDQDGGAPSEEVESTKPVRSSSS